MIYFISLLSSHPLWPPPRASRGSAIHVFLVITYFVRSLSKMSIFRLLNLVQLQLRSACESIQPLLINWVGHNSSLVRVVFPVALGTGVRGQVNHSEALGGQQDSMAFIKIRLVRLFTALAGKTRKKRAIYLRRNENYDNASCTKKERKTNY